MRLKINLATRRYVNMGAVNVLIGAALAACALALLVQVKDIAFNAGELKRLGTGAAPSASAGGRTQQVSEEQYRALMTKIHFANQTLRQKSLDWVALLDRLEEVVPAGVALSQIEPKQKERLLTLGGVAKGFGDLRAFMENLEQSRNFSRVFLLSQQQTKVGLTQQGISFVISCEVPLP